MKSLHTLIKLKKEELESLLSYIYYLEEAEREEIRKMREIYEQYIREMRDYSATEYAFAIVEYRQYTARLEKHHRDTANGLRQQISEQRILLNEKYSELKKMEIALENRLRERSEAIARAEVKHLDEMAISRYNSSKNMDQE